MGFNSAFKGLRKIVNQVGSVYKITQGCKSSKHKWYMFIWSSLTMTDTITPPKILTFSPESPCIYYQISLHLSVAYIISKDLCGSETVYCICCNMLLLYGEDLVAFRPTPTLNTTPCRLSAPTWTPLYRSTSLKGLSF